MTEELTVDTAMSQRFELVEQIAIAEGRHKAELAPLREELALWESYIKDEMIKGNQQQFRSATTGHETHFTTQDSVKVGNWDETLPYIIDNKAYHLLNQAVNKTAAKEHIDLYKAPPPGVEYTSRRVLVWSRGKEKS